MRFDEFCDDCASLPSEMSFRYREISPSIEFTNTGRRGVKSFSISMLALISTLKDIRDNLSEFAASPRYVEATWRDLFSSYVTDEVVNPLSTVQTLPLFSAISKVIHVANNSAATYVEKEMPLDATSLDVTINYLESQVPDDNLHYNSLTSAAPAARLGVNVVYYGAPGTGKSTEINHQVIGCNTTRTIFHADTQNSDFVGCLKPCMVGTSIQYAFRPGPFTKAIVAAVNNKESHHWLVIEEINRAAAAAVFGEVFQLLDRDASGRSEYGISLADEDMADYLRLNAPAAIVDGKLWLPSNLSLLATMNSSDQAVMPLDTAFKRRWQFEYIALDFDKACSTGDLPIVDASDVPAKISWKDFALAVNSVLSENNFPEDRHLGPFFITDSELTEGLKTLTGKLCLYLWDDVLRHGRSELLFSSEIKTYGQLVSGANSGKRIFSETLYGKFKLGAVRTIQERDDIATNDDVSLATEEVLSAVAETPAVYGNGDD